MSNSIYSKFKNIAKENKLVISIFIVVSVVMFLPTKLTALFVTFVNLFIPISVFAMFLQGNLKLKT